MYPVSLTAAYEPERSRLTNFFRYVMVIPLWFVMFFYGITLYLTLPIAWIALSVSGAYPEGLYRWNAKVFRMGARANAYVNLMTDVYPPFHGEEDPSYPVQVHIAPAAVEYSRAKAFFRWIVGIPVIVLAYLFAMLLGAVSMISWVVIVFTGRQPQGLFDLTRSSLLYLLRAQGYVMFLFTEVYPPVTLEPEIEASAAPSGLAS